MFKKFTDISSSGCLSEMWKMKNSLFPKKAHTLPSAKLNHVGRIVSEPQEITKLLGEEYGKFRLRKRPTHPKYEWLKTMRNKALNQKLKVALKKVTKQFTMHELENVLKGLKINKARDPQGLSRILFKNSILGNNPKPSLLKMYNNIKNVGIFPQFMQEATVTTIPKKGSKLLLKNKTGIFLLIAPEASL